MDEAVRGAAGLVGTCAFTPAQDVTLFSDSSRLWGSPVSTAPPQYPPLCLHRLHCAFQSPAAPWHLGEGGRGARTASLPGPPFTTAWGPHSVSRSSKPAGCDAFCPVPQVFLALCHS